MQVLVWQAYGTTAVHAVATPTNFFNILLHLKTEMSGWGEDEALAKLEYDLGIALSPEGARGMIEKFIKPHVGTHELFEVFEFHEVEE